MTDPASGSGDMSHLIQQLRLSDNRRPAQDENAPIDPPQVFQGPPPPGLHPHPHHGHPNHGPPQWNGPPGFAPHGYGHPPPRNLHNQRQYDSQGSSGQSLMNYLRPVHGPGPASPGRPHFSQGPPSNQPSYQPSMQLRPHQRNSFPQNQGYQQQHMSNRSFGSPVAEFLLAQGVFLDTLASGEIPRVVISQEEMAGKQGFRTRLESLCRHAFSEAFPESKSTLTLVPYGSIQSGFATSGSDMDIICMWDTAPEGLEPEVVPRLFEAALLEVGIGARALTRTRIPILKICEKPSKDLHSALLEEHVKWKAESNEAEKVEESKDPEGESDVTKKATPSKSKGSVDLVDPAASSEHNSKDPQTPNGRSKAEPSNTTDSTRPNVDTRNRAYRRERALGTLDFPNYGVGYQCDISFTTVLGVYNTRLLRCYAACDPRVSDMVIFVKSWAKKRKINSGYHGTLCSYGWVLMVLHYLMNIANPPVLPNLQLDFGAAEKPPQLLDGNNVAFADDEAQLHDLARRGRITTNAEPLGSLLRGFFHYFTHQRRNVPGGGFRWTADVLSLRVRGGIVSKASKGWTAASSTRVNNVEVRQRYLLAIECPIEGEHNVARTVHHFGVVAIRDEFRRAWDIIETVGNGRPAREGLFDELVEQPLPPKDNEDKENKEQEVGGAKDTPIDGTIGNVGKRASKP